MIRPVLFVSAVLAVLFLLAMAVVLSGGVPIAASSGHSGVVSYFLDLTKVRSVKVRSMNVEPPPLADESLARLGAAHYQNGCRPCHGSPGEPQPVIPSRMTPQPPDLRTRAPRWQPRELFYIVRHGLKFTGMPAWPTDHRDEEVWALVAFLQRLPSLDGPAYRAMTGRPPGQADSLITRCSACHRPPDRLEPSGLIPRIAGQRPDYIINALRAYASGARPSGIMGPIAAAMSEQEIQGVARFFGSAESQAVPAAGSSPLAGSSFYGGTRCDVCHLRPLEETHPAYPRLDGQREDYIVAQLKLFASGVRGGSPHAEIMRPIAAELSEAQMRDAGRRFAAIQSGLR